MHDSPIRILAGSASQDLGSRIAMGYGEPLCTVKHTVFSDGEFRVSIEETVRGKEVVIVQSTFPPSDNLMELLMLIDAAKRASAKRIVAVIPYFGFARQDRKDAPRVAIGAKLIANMLTAAGVDRVITMDLHADQIQGFFEVPVDHLYGSGRVPALSGVAEHGQPADRHPGHGWHEAGQRLCQIPRCRHGHLLQAAKKSPTKSPACASSATWKARTWSSWTTSATPPAR